jgi:hypothetical protein
MSQEHAGIGLQECNCGVIQVNPGDFYRVRKGVWTFGANGASYTYFFFGNGTTALNKDGIDYKIFLAKGTYTFRCLAITNTNRGIIELLVDGVSQGTLDGYSGGAVNNVLQSIANIVITKSKIYTVTIQVNGKNASSSAYYITFSTVSFLRTA